MFVFDWIRDILVSIENIFDWIRNRFVWIAGPAESDTQYFLRVFVWIVLDIVFLVCSETKEGEN